MKKMDFLVVFLAICTPPLTLGASSYLTDTSVYQVSVVARPALRTPFIDPVFGSTITRWTDPSMLNVDPGSTDGTPLGLRHEYDRVTALNADNTMATLTAIGGSERGAWFVYELSTGKRVMEIPAYAPNGPSITWSRSDPNRAIYYNLNGIDTLNTLNKSTGTLMKLSQYEYIMTGEEGTFSDDWHYAAAFCWKPNADWKKADLCVLDVQAKTVIGVLPDVTTLPNWIGISPSGTYAVAMFDDYTKLYDRNMKFLRNLFPNQSHSDFAYDENGDEVITYITWSSAQCADFNDKCVIAKVRLSDGKKTMLIDTKWKWGSHTSGIGTRAHPGWLLVSDYRDFHPPAAPAFTNVSPFQQEVFWLKMDGSGNVKRIAHHHSIQCDSMGQWGYKDYWAEPHTVSSWDGTTVGFCSIWGSPGSHYDFYTVSGDWWGDAAVSAPAATRHPPVLRVHQYTRGNGVVLFTVTLPQRGDFTLYLCDILGRTVRTYSGKNAAAGVHLIPYTLPGGKRPAGGILIAKLSQADKNVVTSFSLVQ
jgi:hypothetical protein